MDSGEATAVAAAGSRDGAYDDFWEALDEFVHALRRARGRAAATALTGELTVPQYKLLEALGERDSPRIGELAECLDVAPPTATKMIAGLERDGLIERHASPDDRRAVTIELTAAGREARRRAKRRLDARRRQLYESLDPVHREQAPEVLRSLAEGMDAA